jgi:hypothetical protein
MLSLISVTQALSPFNDFSKIDPTVLEKAKNRGQRVHAAIAAHLTGTFLVTPLPEEERPLFDSLRLWCDEMVWEVIAVEPEIKDEALGYVCHPDALVRMKPDYCMAIPDWKTPQVESLSWPVQLSAYRHAAEKLYREKILIYAVQPRPDGKIAKGIPYERNNYHYAIFLNCLNAYRYFKGGK